MLSYIKTIMVLPILNYATDAATINKTHIHVKTLPILFCALFIFNMN